jgi:pyruvate/2-oxoglutarate dehydrogenase complex dihydrolipoamide acyltransferase (E2) component
MSLEVKLPDIGEGVAEGEVVRWLVAEGAAVKEDQPLVEVLTDKANVEIPSPADGILLRILAAPGQLLQVGAALAILETAQRPTPSGSAPAAGPPRGISARRGADVLATPAVRNLAKELGLDLEAVAGSGPGGRVTEEDVRGAAAEKPGAPGPFRAGTETRVPFRGRRRMTARKMTTAKTRVPHALLVEEADVGDILARRLAIRESGAWGGIHVTVLPFLLKAVAAALRLHPALNASLDEARGEIVLKGTCDIGVAVDTGDGLVVPVVRNAESAPITELAKEIERLSAAARGGSLAPQDLSGGTFTVTSVGSVGGLFSYPIINVPEAAILAAHRIVTRPVVRDGAIVAREMMYVSLSFDHRIVDGAEATRFLNDVVRGIERPAD